MSKPNFMSNIFDNDFKRDEFSKIIIFACGRAKLFWNV